MFHLKGCPKCKGDLEVRSDRYGSLQRCLQCGWVKDIPDVIATFSWLDMDSTDNRRAGIGGVPVELVIGKE